MQLLSLEQWITTVFVKALGATFLHSLWQGLLALIACYVLLGISRKVSPAVRYKLLLSISAVLLCSIAVTFSLQFTSVATDDSRITTHPTLQYIIGSRGEDRAPVMEQWQTVLAGITTFFDTYADVFIAIWFLVFSFKALKLSASVSYVQRITNYGSEAVSSEWATVFAKLKQNMGVIKHVQLLQSDIVRVPMTAGFWKPVIIVPMSMLANLSPDMVESILLHELAHIKRRDYLINLIQSIAETIFFFNPFISKISALIKDEREACCDSIAVEVVKNKVDYVNALVAFGHYSTTESMSALAFAGHKNYLLNRVKRILFNQNKKPGVMEKSVLACCLIMSLALAVFSTANGTEKKMKANAIGQLQSLVTDTVPQSERVPAKVNRREVREAKRRAAKSERVSEQRSEKLTKEQRDELEHAMLEVEIERENLEREHEENREAIKEQIEEIKRQQIEIRNDRELRLEQKQRINEDLQQALADVQIQLKNTIDVNTQKQHLQLHQYMNDSVITQLKNIKINIKNDEVGEILDYLEDEGVAKSREITSFSLDENELKVNGKVQPSGMHDELKQRYITAKGDHISYKRSGNSTTISIQRNDPDGDDQD